MTLDIETGRVRTDSEEAKQDDNRLESEKLQSSQKKKEERKSASDRCCVPQETHFTRDIANARLIAVIQCTLMLCVQDMYVVNPIAMHGRTKDVFKLLEIG